MCACLFVVACKGEESKPAPAAKKPSDATPVERSRPRPSLPETPEAVAPAPDRPRPQLPQRETPRDYTDPEVMEEMQARWEERRKRREEMLDTNKDGVVSPEERHARLQPMVDRLDKNGDGKLTPDELSGSGRHRMRFDDPAAVDANKDGEISLAELDAAVTERREKMRARWRGRGGGSADGVSRD